MWKDQSYKGMWSGTILWYLMWQCACYTEWLFLKKITDRKIMQDTISRNVVINMLCSWNNVFLIVRVDDACEDPMLLYFRF
jgi:hypothetical protein